MRSRPSAMRRASRASSPPGWIKSCSRRRPSRSMSPLVKASGTTKNSIIVVGLGPGRWDDLTVEAQAVLDAAPAIVVRTERHPTVDTLQQRRPDLALTSFDALY